MFACFFETNFPIIPFLKPRLLSFLGVNSFLLLFLFCFHGVCFCLSFFMLVLFLLISCSVFVVLFLVLLSVYEKTLFSLQFWCFVKLSWLKR